ncbi:hypothetical protein M2272_000546 [Mycobacterium frederiksbergense]|uniref:Uncharacterized protein n=1 Tax=Mycolicibacterium frederiksbergense TaxID=117567 RepID=A0ABT6KVN0_9MYCO|nr:hypothetical protein [Mycolicibacterium frederiksbergense]
MNNDSHANSVYRYVVAAHEPIKFICPGLHQRKFEQRTTKRHRSALDRGHQTVGFLRGILRTHEVVVRKLSVRIVDNLLENLAVYLEKGSSQRFCLVYHLADGLLKQVGLEWACDSRKHAVVPFGAGATRFLGQPDIQLTPREQICPALRFHRSPTAY